MGTGYTRNDTGNNIADGNVINASDLDGEFDAIQSAFNASTGHSHDGTTGEGPQIGTGGIADLAVTTGKIASNAVTLGTKTSGNYVATIATSAGLDGSASSEGATPTISLNLNELTTSTTDGDGDYFVVVDTGGTQRKLTKANISVSGFNTANGIALGTDTTGNYVATGAVSGVGLSGSASSEGSTFTITSNATNVNTGSTIVSRDASGNFSAGTITAALTGNAATATALETARNIAGNSFDGTANITIASTDLSDASSINAATLDSVDSTSFLRSDAADTKTSGDLSFSDNVKAIFGAGSDLQIYHDGSNSYIDDTGTGDMLIRGSARILLRKAGTTENMIRAEADSYVKLYYDNAEKLATTSTGVDITGDIAVDRVVNSGSASTASTPTYTWGGQQALTGMYLPASSTIAFSTNGTERLRIDSSGNVGIGTTLAEGNMHIFNSSAGTVTAPTDANELVLESTANVGMSFLTANSSIARIKFGDPDATNSGVIAYNHSDDSLTFNASGSARLRVDSGGIDITGGFTATDGSTITTADNSTQLTLKSTDADNNEGPRLDFIRDSASPADNDQIGIMRFLADNDAGTETTYAEISGTLRDVSDGTLGSELRFAVTRNNTLKEVMSLSHTDVILNESGEDINVRIESSANANMFRLDGGINKIGIGKAPTQGLLDVNGAVFSTGLTVDTTTLHVDGTNNFVGIGTAAPADKLHIYKGASGKSSFSANTAILIEDNAAVALQFATPNTVNQQILFSDPESNTSGKIQYQHSTNLMTFDTDGDESMRITSGHTVVGRSEGGTANRVSFTQGSSKSYVTFDMDATNTILDDYNVSSLTDNATGKNTVNIDNNMNNVNYAITFGFEDDSSNVNSLKLQNGAIPTTGAYKVQGGAFQNGSTNTQHDINRAYCVTHGRQA